MKKKAENQTKDKAYVSAVACLTCSVSYQIISVSPEGTAIV